jgi:hypothetical protein
MGSREARSEAAQYRAGRSFWREETRKVRRQSAENSRECNGQSCHNSIFRSDGRSAVDHRKSEVAHRESRIAFRAAISLGGTRYMVAGGTEIDVRRIEVWVISHRPASSSGDRLRGSYWFATPARSVAPLVTPTTSVVGAPRLAATSLRDTAVSPGLAAASPRLRSASARTSLRLFHK